MVSDVSSWNHTTAIGTNCGSRMKRVPRSGEESNYYVESSQGGEERRFEFRGSPGVLIPRVRAISESFIDER
jgi:hypothetical protein